MKFIMLKFVCLLISVITLVCLTGCDEQNTISKSVSINSAEVSTSFSSQESTTSSHPATTSTDNTVTSKKQTTSGGNSTSSKKLQVSTSSKTTSVNSTAKERAAVTYKALETKFENFFKKNSKFQKGSTSSFIYDLPDENFHIIPKDFLNFGTNSFLETTEIYNEERVFSALISQYNDYINYSDVKNALVRDLKIIEEFAGCKPYKFDYFDYGNSSVEKSCEKFSDISEDFLNFFYKGNKQSPPLVVYFGKEENYPEKVKVIFACVSTKTNANSEPIKRYSVSIFVKYNQNEYMDSLRSEIQNTSDGD